MNGTGPAIEARGISKSFGTTRALIDVDLVADAGRVFALLGPNGAGKTTLVRILTTLLRADTGTARVAGFDVEREAAELRHVIGLTAQLAAFVPLFPFIFASSVFVPVRNVPGWLQAFANNQPVSVTIDAVSRFRRAVPSHISPGSQEPGLSASSSSSAGWPFVSIAGSRRAPWETS
jgi:ABC-type Mn2+/Zn2+ transport system ATPase subunit